MGVNCHRKKSHKGRQPIASIYWNKNSIRNFIAWLQCRKNVNTHFLSQQGGVNHKGKSFVKFYLHPVETGSLLEFKFYSISNWSKNRESRQLHSSFCFIFSDFQENMCHKVTKLSIKKFHRMGYIILNYKTEIKTLAPPLEYLTGCSVTESNTSQRVTRIK